jgi:hypothetical protein
MFEILLVTSHIWQSLVEVEGNLLVFCFTDKGITSLNFKNTMSSVRMGGATRNGY